MKYFIKNILLFISIVFSILLCIDFFISKKLFGYTNPSWYNISKNISYDGIIYGSSRAYMHIDPYILSDSTDVDFFNYGVVAGRINTIYLKHKTIFSNKTLIPKYLLISLDPFLFCVNNQIQNKKDFLPILLFNFNAYSILNKKEIAIPDILIPFYRYISYKKTITKSAKNYINNEPDYDKGFFNPLSYESSGWTPHDKEYIDELIKISTLPSHELQMQGVSYLREIIEDCKRSGTEVIFVYTPLYKDTYSIIDTKTLQFHDSIYSTLSEEYNITYLNYKENTKFSNDYKNFVDFTHLTSSNARDLSLIIADTLQNIFREKK